MTDTSALSLTGTILIADDHECVRDSLARALQPELKPRAIIEAETFDAALEVLAGGGIELALFDLDMPGLAGAPQLREVRERWPDVRVVVVTGSINRADVLAALQAGVHGYILKNTRTAEMVRQINSVLAGNIYVPPLVAKLPPRETIPSKAVEANEPETDEPITGRKRQVLEGLAAGLTNKAIARDLGVSEGTVKMHVAALFRVLNASNRAHAAALGKRWLE